MEIKHFVTSYLYEGNAYREITEEINSRELLGVSIPEKAVGFTIYDCLSGELKQRGQTVVTPQDRFNEEIYYIGAFVSADELKRAYGENSTTYKSIVDGGYYGAVKTVGGALVPLKKDDRVNIISPDELRKACGK